MPHPPQIPLTPQTDERNFPRWEGINAPPGRPGCRYPKMLTRLATREDRESWKDRNRRIDQTNQREYFDDVAPRVNTPVPLLTTQEMVDEGLAETANQPIIVKDAEEEARVRVFLGLDTPAPAPQSVTIPIRADDGWVEEKAPKLRNEARSEALRKSWAKRKAAAAAQE